MVAELDTKAKTGDKVDEEHGVLLDGVPADHLVEQPHRAHQFKEHEEDAEHNKGTNLHRRQDLEKVTNGKTYLYSNKDGNQSEHYILSEHASDVGVLVVVHIEETVAVDGR